MVVLAAIAMVSCGANGGEETRPGETQAAPPATGSAEATAPTALAGNGAAMAADAIPDGAIDATREVSGTEPFEIDVVMTKAVSGYQGYQYKVEWDGAVLAYDSQVDLMPAGLELCAAATQRENTVLGGCVRIRDLTNFTGPLNRLTFHCLADGTSPLHLVTLGEDTYFGNSALGEVGVIIETELADATVVCRG
jgi:hypothetical protein